MTCRYCHTAQAPYSSQPNLRGRAEDQPPPGSWERPIPFDKAQVPEFPTSVLPDWLGEWVEAVAEETQTPPDLAGMLSLSVLSTAAGGRVSVHVREGWEEPVNLYTATFIDPAGRKSGVFGLAVEPLLSYEADQLEHLGPEIARAQEERAVLESALKQARGAAAKARDPDLRREAMERVHDLRTELDRLDVPAPPRLFMDDVTPEKIPDLLASHGGRIAILSAEGGICDTLAGRYDSMPNLDAFLKGHAGDPIRVGRKSQEVDQVIDKPALTLGLAIQHDLLRRLGGTEEFRGRGLLARILYSMPTSLLGSRRSDPEPMPVVVRAAYRRGVADVLRRLDRLAAPIVVEFDADAEKEMIRLLEEIEPRLGKGGDLEHMRGWAGKLAGAVARIAGLLFVARGRDQVGSVTAEEVREARTLGAYMLGHARAAFGAMGADPGISDALLILERLRREGWPRFSRRQLYQAMKGASRFKRVDALNPGLKLLEAHGYVRPEGVGRPGRGQASPWFGVNPLWLRSGEHGEHGEGVQ